MITEGWQALLRIRLDRAGGRTILRDVRHEGPLMVQRPFYPEDEDVCHLYILHPHGGVAAGDRLDISIALNSGAHGVLTTPAANKFYRSSGADADLCQRMTVASDASLEWFPQEGILFDGARVRSRTIVDLEEGARFIGWEILCLGRPAVKEFFTRGKCLQSFEIRLSGQLIWRERICLEGGDPLLMAPWGMAGHSVTGTLACVTEVHGLVQDIRESTNEMVGDDFFGVTYLRNVLVCRYLGDSAERARSFFLKAWEILRPKVLGRRVCIPRIWHT